MTMIAGVRKCDFRYVVVKFRIFRIYYFLFELIAYFYDDCKNEKNERRDEETWRDFDKH